MLLTRDNARVFFNMAGAVLSIDTATDTFFFNPTLQQGADYELTLSSNQTWMSGAEYLRDTNLNPQSYVVYVDRDVWNVSAVYGEKVSPDGRDNVLIAITGLTGDGIAIIDLTSLPESVPAFGVAASRSQILRMAGWTSKMTTAVTKETSLRKSSSRRSPRISNSLSTLQIRRRNTVNAFSVSSTNVTS